ncbi:PilZ domain-containing protein [Aneurinibacillus aneurinilyticus]|uniref:PilZ domain-containing protein n=1 Tax=Aneurinibacillus aneurinilyticus TaxID=1391 RepID=UPI002E22FA5F|nr:PilZ domain-containing protein [Aneurinibacillus aneurinilyticus]
MEQDKRQHFRQTFHKPLCAEMTIVRIKGNQVDTKRTKTCILDIGPGGLRFLTNLKIPVNPYIVLEFQTRILDRNLSFHGHIVRKVEGRDEFHEYGVKFVLEEAERMELTMLLNALAIRMRRYVKPASCQFCTLDDHKQCLRGFDVPPNPPDQPHPFASV